MELTFADIWELFSWAILSSVLAGIVCPLVGCFLLVRRTGFYGVALPQFATAGVAAGYALLPWWVANVGLAGLDLVGALESPHALDTYLLVCAGVFTFGGLFLLSLSGSSRSTEAGRVAAAFALAGALTVLFGQLSPAGMDRVEVLLRGEVLVVDVHEFEVMAALYGLVLTLFVVYHRDLLLVSYDRDTALVLGKRVRAIELLLTGLIGVTVSAGVIILGPMVLFGTLLIPPLAARAWSGSMVSFYCLSSAFGLAAALSGLTVSFGFDWPLGPSIVAAAGALWLLAVLVGRLRGSGENRSLQAARRADPHAAAEAQPPGAQGSAFASDAVRRAAAQGGAEQPGSLNAPLDLRVDYRRTGGLGFAPLSCCVDAASAPAEVAAELRALVGASGLLAEGGRFDAGASGRAPDAYTYALKIGRPGEAELAFEFSDPGVPAEVQPLLKFLSAQAESLGEG